MSAAGALVALIGSLLPFVGGGGESDNMWHARYAEPWLAVILSIVAAVLVVVLGGRKPPEVMEKAGLSWNALAFVTSLVAFLEMIASYIGFHSLFGTIGGGGLKASGVLFTLVGLVAAVVGSGGLIFVPAVFDKVLVGGIPKPAALGAWSPPGGTTTQPATPAPGWGSGPLPAGEPAAAPGWGAQPAPSAGQPAPAPTPSWEPTPAPAPAPAAEETQATPAYQQWQPPTTPEPTPPAAPTQPEPYVAPPTMLGRESWSQQGPTEPAFSPYWAAVTATIPAYSAADGASRVGDVNPGAWFLVTGQHPQGVLIDLNGRPVLVKDVGSLVRG